MSLANYTSQTLYLLAFPPLSLVSYMSTKFPRYSMFVINKVRLRTTWSASTAAIQQNRHARPRYVTLANKNWTHQIRTNQCSLHLHDGIHRPHLPGLKSSTMANHVKVGTLRTNGSALRINMRSFPILVRELVVSHRHRKLVILNRYGLLPRSVAS